MFPDTRCGVSRILPSLANALVRTKHLGIREGLTLGFYALFELFGGIGGGGCGVARSAKDK